MGGDAAGVDPKPHPRRLLSARRRLFTERCAPVGGVAEVDPLTRVSMAVGRPTHRGVHGGGSPTLGVSTGVGFPTRGRPQGWRFPKREPPPGRVHPACVERRCHLCCCRWRRTAPARRTRQLGAGGGAYSSRWCRWGGQCRCQRHGPRLLRPPGGGVTATTASCLLRGTTPSALWGGTGGDETISTPASVRGMGGSGGGGWWGALPPMAAASAVNWWDVTREARAACLCGGEGGRGAHGGGGACGRERSPVPTPGAAEGAVAFLLQKTPPPHPYHPWSPQAKNTSRCTSRVPQSAREACATRHKETRRLSSAGPRAVTPLVGGGGRRRGKGRSAATTAAAAAAEATTLGACCKLLRAGGDGALYALLDDGDRRFFSNSPGGSCEKKSFGCACLYSTGEGQKYRSDF